MPTVLEPTAQVEPSAKPALPVRPTHQAWRLFIFYSAAVVLTGAVSLLFADLLWRTGWGPSSTLLLVWFVILFLLSSIGCMHGLFGFVLSLTDDRLRLTNLGEYRSRSIEGAGTAVLFPVYNEDAERVYERLRATYQSLEKTGCLASFDFFVLSDSTLPERWLDEERLWFDLIGNLRALGRIYYRRRSSNEGKKSGNIRDFLKAWGRRYRYFIVLDADSVMRGQTLVDMVKLMEANPGVGLVQTVPALVNAESLFGRIQQFANRLYAPLFIRGLNFWAQGLGNYWGHNAIIRTEPFMQCCDLPRLPGARPFGGHILSHDFVEAALLLRENWQVWFAYDLEGSYEEAPQGMTENAQRDRRWCQGNLQHTMVLFARGLRGISRIHLLLGIFGYLASPLWLAFLLTFNWALWFKHHTGLSNITVRAFTPFLHLSGTEHALLIFVLCMAVILLPKFLALVHLALSPRRRREFGSFPQAFASVIGETLFSTLHAPLQMLWHSKFVISSLLGMEVSWGPQKRRADGIAWREGLWQHWGHTLIGLGWGGLVWLIDPATFWWFAPVVAGMVASIPLSVFTSRDSWGRAARKLGFFLTPEETAPPAELRVLRNRTVVLEGSSLEVRRRCKPDITAAVLDPYLNAIHVSLLREKRLNPEYTTSLQELGIGALRIRELAQKLLVQGPDALTGSDHVLVLSDPDTMSWLHRQAWLRPAETLAPWWRAAISRRYVSSGSAMG